MSYPVLVINTDFQPYDIWSWQKTMKKLLSSNSILPLYDDNGEIIKHDKLIRDSRGNVYDLPAVVKLRQFVNVYNRRTPYSKTNVYARDAYVCQYCGKLTDSGDRTVDHVIPRSFYNGNGHSFKVNDFTNVVTACVDCNYKKKNRTPEQAGMKLLRKPFKPNRAHIYINKLNFLKHKPLQWQPFLQSRKHQINE